jgi:hypothetical protein
MMPSGNIRNLHHSLLSGVGGQLFDLLTAGEAEDN